MNFCKLSARLFFVLILGLQIPVACKPPKKPAPKVNTSTPKIQRVTNRPMPDGFGSQFLDVISVVIYAELHGMQFVYNPFTRMEHNYDNDPDFIQKKEWLTNFIGNYEINIKKDIWGPQDALHFFALESNMAHLVNSPAMKKVKQVFRANKTHNCFNNNNFNIAVHVRRHNVHDSRIDGTDTSDDFYLSIIDKLRIIYADKNLLFHLHSQGEVDNFKAYESEDTIFHLNESIEDSFTAMVFADVLVTSRSTFSYTAGLLSDGIVYYMPFWFARLPHWITVNNLLEVK